MEKTVRGYAVQGRCMTLGITFMTGLEETEKKARKTLKMMTTGMRYSEEEKETFKVVRVCEVIEAVE